MELRALRSVLTNSEAALSWHGLSWKPAEREAPLLAGLRAAASGASTRGAFQRGSRRTRALSASPVGPTGAGHRPPLSRVTTPRLVGPAAGHLSSLCLAIALHPPAPSTPRGLFVSPGGGERRRPPLAGGRWGREPLWQGCEHRVCRGAPAGAGEGSHRRVCGRGAPCHGAGGAGAAPVWPGSARGSPGGRPLRLLLPLPRLPAPGQDLGDRCRDRGDSCFNGQGGCQVLGPEEEARGVRRQEVS